MVAKKIDNNLKIIYKFDNSKISHGDNPFFNYHLILACIHKEKVFCQTAYELDSLTRLGLTTDDMLTDNLNSLNIKLSDDVIFDIVTNYLVTEFDAGTIKLVEVELD